MGAVGLRDLNVSTYPWNEERMEPDIDASCKLIREIQPKITLVGQSVFLFPTPLRELADAAHEVGSTVMYDGAHVLGLLAGGVFQAPLRAGADVMTGPLSSIAGLLKHPLTDIGLEKFLSDYKKGN